jgi:hypothetical protein
MNIQKDITIKLLADGAREITHPSGIKTIETRKQRQSMRAELVRMAAEIAEQIKALDEIDF